MLENQLLDQKKCGNLVWRRSARVGDRVKSSNDWRDRGKKGTITSTTEDNSSEVGVKWDDGTESHFLACGKRGRFELVYAFDNMPRGR